MTTRTWAAALLLLVAFLLAYLPDIGHGFVSDDFTWLVTARGFLDNPSLVALGNTTDFLRPVVTLSFASNLALLGGGPAAAALTNLFLVLASAALIYGVCRALPLSPPAAIAAAATWMFNFHGINMSLLWISGRTSLLLTLFAVLTALLVLKHRPWTAALCCGAALFSKEEAVALPLVLAAWTGVRAAWPLAVPLAMYLVVRLQTHAFWPQRAPDYYRFTTDLGALATNGAHYLDRGGTVFAIAAIVLVLAARTRPVFSDQHRRQLFRGLAWFAGGYALTVWVPVRSSLYAVFPSVGAAILLGVLADRVFARADTLTRFRAAGILVALPFLLWPVYRARNVRWVELADLTMVVVPQMEAHVPAMRAGTPIWIQDDDTTRANIRNAFGGQMASAMRFYYDVDAHIVVEGGSVEPPQDAVRLRLLNGALQHR